MSGLFQAVATLLRAAAVKRAEPPHLAGNVRRLQPALTVCLRVAQARARCAASISQPLVFRPAAEAVSTGRTFRHEVVASVAHGETDQAKQPRLRGRVIPVGAAPTVEDPSQ